MGEYGKRLRYAIVGRTPACRGVVQRSRICRAIELGRFGRVWEVLGSGQSPLQPVDALLWRAIRWVMLRLPYPRCRSGFAAFAAMHNVAVMGGKAPKSSQTFPILLNTSHQSRHQPYCPRMRRNAASAATHNIATAGGNTPKNSQNFSKLPNTSHQSRHLLVQSAFR